IEETTDPTFSFDIELLLRVELSHAHSICTVPIAWIDSDAASTTRELDPYLAMLKKVVSLYRRALPPSATSEPFATLIEGLDAASFRAILDRIPSEIATRDPGEFDDFDGVGADQLANLIG
ncbi:MAG: hypothetical protein HKO77_06180, partial [Gemmatimonadetes bacterium]|nr:hypothetical protein [Gemmatimonadota bacterium]